MRLFFVIATMCVISAAARAAPPDAPPVSVMIVGVFHMANPGHDLHNLQADDVLASRRQAEIAAVTEGLARFKPTKIAVEWPADLVAERYPKFLDGILPPSRNEVVQLGFRLAKTAGAEVHGVDVEGEFPYEPVKAWADAHGKAGLLDAEGGKVDRLTQGVGRLLAEHGVVAALRTINDPRRLAGDNAFYRTMLHMGAGAEQPGAELLSAWYHRNFLICANLIQLARPGDRIVVLYGFGHAFLLRQCVSETPGFVLVEPDTWLPD